MDRDRSGAAAGRRDELEVDVLAQLVRLRGPRAAGALIAIGGGDARAPRLVDRAPRGVELRAQRERAGRVQRDQLAAGGDDRAPRRGRVVARIGLDDRRLGEPRERGLDPLALRRREREPALRLGERGRRLGRGRGVRRLGDDARRRGDRRTVERDAHRVVDHGDRQVRDPDARRDGAARVGGDRRDAAHARAALVQRDELDP